MRVQGGSSIFSMPKKTLKLTDDTLIFIQSAQDKVFSCLLFTVLFTIISIISSTILKLHIGLVLFLDKICLHEFIGGYPFFYAYCADMLKQNHWEQRPMCSADKQVHRPRRIITLQGVTWRNIISVCRK